jgi:hypothetical protein
MENNKSWSSTRVYPGTLAFHNIYIYINDFPPTINISSEAIIFADDTDVIISSKMFDDFCAMSEYSHE